MGINLSHSSISTYKDCQFKYYLNKVEKIRPTWTSSPLIIGTAFDAAAETMLLNLKDGTDVDPFDVFVDSLSTCEVNGKTVNVSSGTTRIRWSAADLQPELIPEDTLVTILDEFDVDEDEFDMKDFLEYVKLRKRAKKPLDGEDQQMYNKLAYVSMLEKGKLIIPVLQQWIDENVQEVHSTQQLIRIENDEGDVLRGFLDFVVTLKDGTKILIDLKTSSDAVRAYPEGCVETSQQLAIYGQEVELVDAGYLVIDKKIRKRDPRVRLHWVRGTLSEEHTYNTFVEIEEVLDSIKEGNFEKNEKSCMNYGGCQYWKYCKKGGDMSGLVKIEEKSVDNK